VHTQSRAVADGWLDEEALSDALLRIRVPALVVDSHEIIRWQNRGARELLGNAEGKRLESYIDRRDVSRIRREFTRTMLGSSEGAEYEATLITAGGVRTPVEISDVPITEEGRVVAVFGVLVPRPGEPPPATPPMLTPRQHEVLLMLADGHSTTQLADTLSISQETVRNHVKVVLRSLGARSRLEAVVRAQDLKIV
jgi:DNA-binding CsgD family transcriptional regulator